MINGRNSLTDFFKGHKIFANVLLIIFANCVLLALSYFALGWFTNHNDRQTVPDIHGLTADDAASILAKHNLNLEISDSSYIDGVDPGCILEQNPKAGSAVKENRIIYVTVRTYSAKTVRIPSLTDVSARQGESVLKSSGIKDVRIQTIPSEYADLIYDVKWNGTSLHAGDRIPVNATVTLVVGDGSLSGSADGLYDSLPADGDFESEYDYIY